MGIYKLGLGLVVWNRKPETEKRDVTSLSHRKSNRVIVLVRRVLI